MNESGENRLVDGNIRIDAGTDTGSFDLRPRDRLIVCSDGLSTPVEDHRIADVIRETPEPQASATALMERSLASGSDDNVTVIVARIDTLAKPVSRPEFVQSEYYDVLGNEVAARDWDTAFQDALLPRDTDPGA